MNSNLEPSESVLRKTLDAVDRKRKTRGIASLAMIVFAVFLYVETFSLPGFQKGALTQEVQRVEFMSGLLALTFMILGVAAGIMHVVDTRSLAILKAIELIDSKGKENAD